MTEYPDVTFTRLFTSVSPEQIQNLEVKAPNHVSTSLLNYYILQNQNSGYEEEIVDKLKASSLIEDAYMKKQEKIMPPEVQSSSVALNPNNNPRFKNKVILKQPHTVLMRLSPGEFKAVMEMVLLLLIWNTDGY